MSDAMERMACPRCGSEWFVSARNGSRVAFQMDNQLQPVLTAPLQHTEEAAMINSACLYCGACSWQGTATDLVESMM